MSEPPIPIVWGKLQLPFLPEHVVDGARILDGRADQRTPVLWSIVAPAGYGKTTTAIQIAAWLGSPTFWLTLDEGDNDQVSFWSYVCAALDPALENSSEVYAELRRGEAGVKEAAEMIRSAIEDLENPITVVLDDFHAIDQDEILKTIGRWLRTPPRSLTLVCTSRSELPLPVGRLRTAGDLVETRTAELAFDRNETLVLLDQAFGLRFKDDEEIEQIFERTEGWPVGVYLAGLSLRGDGDVDGRVASFAGDSRHVSEYLSLEAIRGLTEEIREFLVLTSIADVLLPELCDELVGRTGSLAILRGLASESVFTMPLDVGASVFRYHRLFRDHLLSTLKAERPDEVRNLHRRAAKYFERTGDIDQAIRHTVRAGDLGRGYELVGESWTLGHYGAVKTWVDLLGADVTESPRVCLMMSWAALSFGHEDEAAEWCDRAEERMDRQHHQTMMVTTSMIRAYVHRVRGELDAMANEAAMALDLAYADPYVLDGIEQPRPDVERLRDAISYAEVIAGITAFLQNQIEVAEVHLQAALRSERTEATARVGPLLAACFLAIMRAEDGEFDEALQYAQMPFEGNVPSEPFFRPAMAYLARAVVALERGQLDDAMPAANRAHELIRATGSPHERARISLYRARIYHRLGQQRQARESLRKAQELVALTQDEFLDEFARSVKNEIRFVRRSDDKTLPIGARELTKREMDVLRILPGGLSRPEVAAHLSISENTLKTHLTSISRKLGVSGRASIVRHAVELGLLES